MSISRKTTRELIFESYNDLFRHTSFEDIRVSDICRNCGIDRQRFYYSNMILLPL